MFFLGRKHSMVQAKNIFLAKFLCKFVAFLPLFSLSARKTLKIKILTTIWSGQYPNPGLCLKYTTTLTRQSLLYPGLPGLPGLQG